MLKRLAMYGYCRNQAIEKQTFSLALVDTGEQDGKVVEQNVREFAYAGELPQQWTIEYRHGLVIVLGDGKPILSAHIANGSAAVAAVALQTESQTIRLSQYDLAAALQSEIVLTAAEEQELVKLYRENERLVQFYRAGKVAEAAKIGEQVLETCKHILSEGHPIYATSLFNLAMVYESMGEYARAEPLYLQARDIRKKVLGKEHPDYALSLNNLALLYQTMGEYARAEPLYLQARGIRKKVLGDEHPDYANSLYSLAVVYYSMGDYTRAELLLLQARDIWKKVLGKEHPDYALSLNNLAALYESMGESARAEPLYLQARDINKIALGEEHPSYADSLNNLAVLYKSMGDYARAEPLFLQAINIKKKILGEEHPSYAASLNSLALLYQSMGEYARAEPLLLQARDIRNKVLGKEHPDYALSLNNLAVLYYSMGDYARAEPPYLQARDILKKVLGEEHPDYATSLNNLAMLYESIGQYARAEPLLVKARDIRKKVLGEEHPDYTASLQNLAGLYYSMGAYARAEPLYLEAIEVASAAAEKAVPSLSGAEAMQWVAQDQPRTDLLFSILRRHDPAELTQPYQSIWKTKSLATRLRITQTVSNDAAPEIKKLAAELRDVRMQLAGLVTATPKPDQAEAYQQKLADTSQRKEQLEKQLAAVNPATKRALSIRDAKVEDLLEVLPPKTAVVDLSLLWDWRPVEKTITLKQDDGTEKTRVVKEHKPTLVYDAFILRGDQDADAETLAEWVQLGDAEPINAAVAKWRGQLTGEQSKKNEGSNSGPNLAGENSDPAETLRKLVWSKLEPHLEGCHTVIILPDGDLNKVPWVALPGRKPGTYLIEDYAIATANYGQQLFGLLSDEAPKGNQLLVAGGIKYDQKPINKSVQDTQLASRTLDVAEEDRSWAYLTGAENEAKEVLKLWQGSRESNQLIGNRSQ